MVSHGKWAPSIAAWLLISFSLGAQVQPSPSVSRLRHEAARAEAGGDTEKAIRLYAQILAKTPEWTEGWWAYGNLLYGARRFADAAQAFGRLTRLAPDNPLGFAMLGLCEYEQGDWNNSGFHLNKSLGGKKAMPASITQPATYHLGLVLMRQGNGAGALVAFKALFLQAPDYPGLSSALGSAQLNLEEVPAVDSPLFPAVRMAGEAAIAILQNRKKDAEDAYRALIAQFPEQPFVHLDRGMLLEDEHRDEEASAEFLAETKTNPDSAVPWLWLGRVALERRDAAGARADALQARKLNPDDALSFLIEGRGFMLDRRWEEALGPLREAERRAPQSSEIHYALVSVYTALHRNSDAEQERELFLQTSKSEDKP